jgi:hypothetical protein
MFGRAEKDPGHVSESPETTACWKEASADIERATREFFEAHAAIVAFSSGAGLVDSQSAVSLASLKLARDRAVRAVRQHRASNWSDIHAKMAVFFALEDWFGCEESAVAWLSAAILHEAAPFLAADQAKVLSGNFAEQSSQPVRLTWFDRLPRLCPHAQNQPSSD